MAPNSIKTKEEETMVIKVEERSMDMFAPAWVQESTQVLKKKVESTQVLKKKEVTKEKSPVLKTKVVATKKVRKEENPSSQSRELEMEKPRLFSFVIKKIFSFFKAKYWII